MIKVKANKLHWNYFLALEQDLERISRYIEFCKPNLKVFSIELAHLLLAAGSEVDVLAKCICEIIAPAAARANIDHYRLNITKEENLPIRAGPSNALSPNPATKISALRVHILRYGLAFIPWENWARQKNPAWRTCYNNVKHERNHYFHEASLQNAVNALGALLIMNYYYRLALTVKSARPRRQVKGPSITRHLEPQSTFMRLPKNYYESLNKEIAELGQAVFSAMDS
jgi:hypothetical protein